METHSLPSPGISAEVIRTLGLPDGRRRVETLRREGRRVREHSCARFAIIFIRRRANPLKRVAQSFLWYFLHAHDLQQSSIAGHSHTDLSGTATIVSRLLTIRELEARDVQCFCGNLLILEREPPDTPSPSIMLEINLVCRRPQAGVPKWNEHLEEIARFLPAIENGNMGVRRLQELPVQEVAGQWMITQSCRT